MAKRNDSSANSKQRSADVGDQQTTGTNHHNGYDYTDEPLTTEEVIAELTLMLLRLTAWDEGKPPLEETRSWKTYDWDTLDALQDMGCLSFTKAAKSVALTGKGRDIADRMIDDYLFIREELPKIMSLIADKHPEIMSELFDQLLDEYKHKAGSSGEDDGHGDSVDEPVTPNRAPSAKSAAQRTSTPDSRAFRIRATMRFEELTCWREMLVPANFTFLDLHCLIQCAFLFLDYHLWDFRLTSQGVKLKIDESVLLVVPSVPACIFSVCYNPGKGCCRCCMYLL